MNLSDPSRFIGVIVYSAQWNHFWQFNKTLALILSYVYSCINPFALYILSSTFRHFYKRYLFFWTYEYCCTSNNALNRITRARRARETLTFSDCPGRFSVNNVSSMFSDLNRLKAPTYFQHQSSPPRTNRCIPAAEKSIENGNQKNGGVTHWTVRGAAQTMIWTPLISFDRIPVFVLNLSLQLFVFFLLYLHIQYPSLWIKMCHCMKSYA